DAPEPGPPLASPGPVSRPGGARKPPPDGPRTLPLRCPLRGQSAAPGARSAGVCSCPPAACVSASLRAGRGSFWSLSVIGSLQASSLLDLDSRYDRQSGAQVIPVLLSGIEQDLDRNALNHFRKVTGCVVGWQQRESGAGAGGQTLDAAREPVPGE